MKTVTNMVKQLLLMVLLSASLATVQAADRGNSVGSLKTFQSGGIVSIVDSTKLIADGKQFRFSSSFEFLESSKKKSVGSIQTGDQVWLKGKILNDVFYIDVISVLPSSDDS